MKGKITHIGFEGQSGSAVYEVDNKFIEEVRQALIGSIENMDDWHKESRWANVPMPKEFEFYFIARGLLKQIEHVKTNG